MLGAAAVGAAVACGGESADPGSRAGTRTARAARQPIPAGVDPAMIAWREDGVLVASRDSLLRTPGYVVDSILPLEEGLRRVQLASGGPPVHSIAGGFESPTALLDAYWTYLVAGDTSRARALALTSPEWAYIYLPSSSAVSAGIQPVAAAYLRDLASARGLVRALKLARDPGRNGASVIGTFCERTEVRQDYRLLGNCALVVRRETHLDTLRLGATVFEQHKRFKLLDLQNAL